MYETSIKISKKILGKWYIYLDICQPRLKSKNTVVAVEISHEWVNNLRYFRKLCLAMTP